MAIADDEIEKLIEEVAKYPHLYIVKRGDYKDQVKRKKFLEPDIKHFFFFLISYFTWVFIQVLSPVLP